MENGVQQRITHVGAGSDHSVLVTESGAAFVCGFGDSYRLGTGEEDNEVVPVPVRGQRLQGRRVILADAGSFHTIFAAIANPAQNDQQ